MSACLFTVYNKCCTCLEPSAIGIESFHGLAIADARMADLKMCVLVFSASDLDSGSIIFSFFPLRSFSVFLVRSFCSFCLLSPSFSAVFKVREEVHIVLCKIIGVLNISTAVSQMTFLWKST